MKKIVFLLIFLSLVSVNAINPTYSYYLDSNSSTGNTFSASTLDFSLRDTTDVLLVSPLFNISGMIPGDSETKTLRVKKEATEDYKYQITYEKTGGDDVLCSALQLEAKFEGITKYSGSLSSLNITPVVTNTGASDDWDLIVSLTDNSSSLRNKTCSFNLIFKGWQTNSDGTWGFSSTKTLSNTVSTGAWVAPGDVVINEIMWMGSSLSTADEWIELRNTTSSPINLTGWKIDNAGESGSSVTLSGTIPANGFFLLSDYATNASALSDTITADQITVSLSLINTGEQLALRNSANVVIDQTPSGAWTQGVDGPPDWKSMERNDDPSTGWHTCSDSACHSTAYWDSDGNNWGTPKSANLSSNDSSSPDFVPPATSVPVLNSAPEASSSAVINNAPTPEASGSASTASLPAEAPPPTPTPTPTTTPSPEISVSPAPLPSSEPAPTQEPSPTPVPAST